MYKTIRYTKRQWDRQRPALIIRNEVQLGIPNDLKIKRSGTQETPGNAVRVFYTERIRPNIIYSGKTQRQLRKAIFKIYLKI